MRIIKKNVLYVKNNPSSSTTVDLNLVMTVTGLDAF